MYWLYFSFAYVELLLCRHFGYLVHRFQSLNIFFTVFTTAYLELGPWRRKKNVRCSAAGLSVNVGWLGGAMVLCSLHHRGVQLILAYSWARPATLVAGKGRGGMFLFLLFLHFHSCSPFFPVLLFLLLYYLFYLFSPFFRETTQNDPQGLTCR